MNIQFISQIPEFQLNTPLVYRNILEKCAKEENRSIQKLIYRFVSEEIILSVNKEFLNHNYVTDIITFDDSFLQVIEGEIFICISEVKRNCKKHSAGYFINELNRVVLHGLLHLIGYKDSDEKDIQIMREKESYYMQYFK